MITLRPFLAAILALAIPATGLRAKEPDAPPQPYDLTPVSPQDRDGYYSLVRKLLISPDDNRSDFWMIVRPSFQSEYALDLRLGENPTATAALATKQIWNWKDNPDNTMTLDLRKDVKIDRKTRAFSPALARRISTAWLAALSRTHYTNEETMGLDGTTYEFHALNRYGETWEPGRGVALAIAELGQTLYDYARDKKIPEEKLAEKVTTLETALKTPVRGL